MDTKIVDQDVLGLTFVFEVEPLSSTREIELCPKGKDIIVENDKQEEAMLMSNMDRGQVTDQCGHEIDNDSDVYESILFSG
ncbi:hypothetical protein H5410_002571 [Solanum commersonii]|uniref:Uncharacterized protein n=1 Tax=Solanum commersonii TaxID=4109 RepID=A0A9J6B2A7_SOLCO|nr:hypothetical protein H5410_002571 [Solanum commersonii]